MKENIDRIINKSCELWNVSREDVLGRRRNVPLPFARYMITKMIRDTLGLSYPEIGKIMGRSHSATFYYYKLYDAEYKYNQEFRNFANAMREVVMDIRTNFQEELDEELNEIIG